MNLQESIRRILREVFDSKSTFKRNVYGGEEEYRETTKNRTIIWNPEYNIAFQYIFDDRELLGYTFIHLYPYTEDGHYYRWDTLEDSIKSKIFVDALKKLPKVLKNYFKKFGKVDNIIFRPKTEQMGNIYSSPSVIRHLESEFGSDYTIEVNTEESSHLPVNTVIMRLKNEGEPINESIRRILREVRVPRSERVELYKDENIIVVVPLTHRALQKYAHQCQWCINSDLDEWEDYHKGKHAVIIQRNPNKPKIGIKYPIPSEIFTIEHYTDIDSIYNIIGYRFSSNEDRDDYMDEVTSNINNFATNIVYYSPSDSLYDQEDNYLPSYGYSISDIPNVTPEVIQIMDNYLQKNEEMTLQESFKRILKEVSLKQNLMDEIMRSGIRDTANIIGVDVKELLDMVGITGTKEDMIFLIEAIMENEVKEQLKYCDYNITPSFGSIILDVYIPEPAPEDEGRWITDQWVRNQAEELISNLSYELGGGLIRGHYINVFNTGKC